jgi:transcriptional regulator with XRE-family HTH domain
LTIAQVRAIRNRRGVSQSIIADEFGISQAQVSRIRTGALWVHVRIT